MDDGTGLKTQAEVTPPKATNDMPLGTVIAIITAGFGMVLTILLNIDLHHWAILPFLGWGISITAALSIEKTESARNIKDGLEKQDYKPLYDYLLSNALTRSRRFFGMEAPAKTDTGLPAILRASFSYGLLDRALLIAVIYPVAALILHWGLFGQAGMLGTTEIIPAVDEPWKGYATLGVIVIVIVAYKLQTLSASSQRLIVRRVSSWLGPTSVFAGLIILISLKLHLELYTVIYTSVFIILFAVSFAITFITILTVIRTTESLWKHTTLINTILVSVFAPLGIIFIPLYAFPWDTILPDVRPRAMAIFLFINVLPLINALFDMLSYGITLSLAERGRHGSPFWWGLLDLLIAAVLFLALGMALVAFVVMMQAMAGVPFVDLENLLTHSIDFKQYWWLYAMLFSTALPTLIHLALACLALQTVLRPNLRQRVSDWITHAGEGATLDGVWASLSLGTIWFLSLALPFTGLGAVIWVLWSFAIGPFLYGYQDWLVVWFTWLHNMWLLP